MIFHFISPLGVLYQSSGLLLNVEVVIAAGSKEPCPTCGALAVACYTPWQAVAAENMSTRGRQHSAALCPSC